MVFDASKCRMVQPSIKLLYHRILLRLPGMWFHGIGIGSTAMMWTQIDVHSNNSMMRCYVSTISISQHL